MSLDLVVLGKTKKKAKLAEKPPSLIKVIENYALTEMQPRQGYFRPSMLAGGCDRANIFHYLMAPEDNNQIPPGLRRILDNGTAVHDLIQRVYLAEHPEFWYAPEARIRRVVCGVRVWGSCDGVLIRRSDLYKFGVELKSINHTEFMRLTKPKEDHVMQARIYMELQDLDWIVVLYWDKDKQHLKEFPVSRHSKSWAEVKDYLKYLRKFLRKKTLPKYDRRQCNLTFCKFVKHCRSKGAPV